FWGGSVGWKISNEAFWDEYQETISNFEIRASYAETGNTNIGAYPYLGIYGVNKYGSQTGIEYSQFGNANLLWETREKYNIGLDLAFINDRIRFSAEYFRNDTKDMVINRSTAPSLGIPENQIKINAGDMRNTGIEFSIDGDV